MAAFDFGVKVDPVLFDRQINEGYEVTASEYIRKGWEMFRLNIGEFVGFTLVVFVISALSSMSNGGGSIIFSSLTAPLCAGFGIAVFKRMSGQEIQFSDFFLGFKYLLPLFLAGLAMGLLVAVGLVLLILPGIYLAVGYTFTMFLIVDYRMEFWQAMETSRKIVTRQWWAIFGFACLLALLNFGGALALGVGLLVTIPVSSCAVAIAYKEIVGLYSSEW
ncbi:hypothetical protein [Chlorobium sp. KB01]|uniref:hypothetical protein n=1 Tax=Chlorobium sp. KB01 TaxID=1917528 RepID=UPI00097691EE|nr:hypothetical protein [Chlorobium sp. KB01]